jgi:hypothetical protein
MQSARSTRRTRFGLRRMERFWIADHQKTLFLTVIPPSLVHRSRGPWRPCLAFARATTASGGTVFRRKPGNEFLLAKWWKCF